MYVLLLVRLHLCELYELAKIHIGGREQVQLRSEARKHLLQYTRAEKAFLWLQIWTRIQRGAARWGYSIYSRFGTTFSGEFFGYRDRKRKFDE